MSSFSLVRRGRPFLIGVVAVIVAVVVAVLAVVVQQRVASQSRSLSIEILSSRPDAVTGGDARVRVSVPEGIDPADVLITLDDRDVSAALPVRDGHREGVLKGLRTPTSTVEASVSGAGHAETALTNHPSTGPMLAGPHEEPYVCQTQSFTLVSGGTLGPPLDADCSVKPRVDYVYRTTGGAFRPLPAAGRTDPGRRPADLATTKLADGTTAPFVVRVETRTVDRGIAQVAMLDDPADPAHPHWNRKLVYTFGGGCDGGWYVQGTKTGGVMSPRMLSQGYAIASNSLNVFAQNCNDLLATEAFAMTREQFIEDHGTPVYTMGIGCSGGSYQAHQIADNYPGMLDGIVVGCSFADVGFDTGQMLFDARLLSDYNRNFPGKLSAEQLRQVAGFGSAAAVKAMGDAANRLKPQGQFDAAVPTEDRYDAKTNPTGARSTIWDHTVNVYGRFAETGFARRPVDNVGVQYGLSALQDGVITGKQFLDLNAAVGGLDLDLKGTSARTVGDSQAIQAAYSTGRMLNGGGGLGSIPIIDYRSYTEGPTSTDLHMRYHTFVTEARLVAANGDADNRVRLTVDGSTGFDLERGQLAAAIDAMDRWILQVQRSGRASHQSVVAARPTDLVDACWTPAGKKIVERQTYDGSGACNKLYPSFASPRLVAGEPLAADVVACSRRPVEPTEYGGKLTVLQLARLRAVFPDGVCDWNQPGRGQRKPAGSWTFIR